ncbi:MAG: preprotein translocase subunit SecE [Candidatus Pacebacteria bacterium]|jgi:preprotein translocase SecE subunit|nr:preprotein translocase subunit SecE [Candidatus Paceibacterota bacterium]
MSSFIAYLKATKEELKEVRFPTIPTTISYTIIVIVVSVAIAVLLGAVDLGLKEAVAKLIIK